MGWGPLAHPELPEPRSSMPALPHVREDVIREK